MWDVYSGAECADCGLCSVYCAELWVMGCVYVVLFQGVVIRVALGTR